MRLKDMVVGRKYLIGDGYGYDKVECLEHNPSDADFPGCHVVKVKFLERSALIDDFFFESADYSGLYIEEIV